MKTILFTKFKFLILMLLLIMPMAIMAQSGMSPEEVTPTTIAEWLTPVIVLLAVWGVRKLKPSIPGWATMLVVTALSAAVAWITTLLSDTADMSFITQTLYGLLAVFINQLYRQFSDAKEQAQKRK
jgi:MFS superfamily sulfate permease-like transporter